MCLICVELIRNRLTAREARVNLREMRATLDDDHLDEVKKKIVEQEKKERRRRR